MVFLKEKIKKRERFCVRKGDDLPRFFKMSWSNRDVFCGFFLRGKFICEFIDEISLFY